MWTILYELLEGVFFDILICYPFIQLGIFLLDFLKLNFNRNNDIKPSNRIYKKRLVMKRHLKKQYNSFFNKN